MTVPLGPPLRPPVKKPGRAHWRDVLHEVIFEADTPSGKLFDVVLIVSILISVAVVMVDSVRQVNARFGQAFYIAEWFFTLLFTVEYVLRLISVDRPGAYARSFFGIVDLLAILPTYLSLLLPGARVLLVIRLLRVLRIFRVLKLVPYVGEARQLQRALYASRRKITVFVFVVLTIVVVCGSLMYLIEGEQNGFSSIPRSAYWAIVTLTTVGYGDISPQTAFGQAISAIIMVIGYGIIAVPTGIVTAELTQAYKPKVSTQSCRQCSAEGHDPDAKHCKYCGAEL